MRHPDLPLPSPAENLLWQVDLRFGGAAAAGAGDRAGSHATSPISQGPIAPTLAVAGVTAAPGFPAPDPGQGRPATMKDKGQGQPIPCKGQTSHTPQGHHLSLCEAKDNGSPSPCEAQVANIPQIGSSRYVIFLPTFFCK
jgi:hypothetical protein